MNKKLINLRLSSSTIKKIDNIQSHFSSPSRTQAIVNTVNLTHELISLKKFSKIYIEHLDGSRDRLLLIGLS